MYNVGLYNPKNLSWDHRNKNKNINSRKKYHNVIQSQSVLKFKLQLVKFKLRGLQSSMSLVLST